MTKSVECVLPARAKLGECPVWSVGQGLLYWVDIDGCAVHSFDPDAGTDRVWQLEVRPSAIARTNDPERLLVAAENELAWLQLDTGELVTWVTLEVSKEGVRLNDGRCDPAGRLWIGGMYVPTSAMRFEAFLHRVEPDGTFVTVRDQVGCANGSAFSPDGSVMYWADTLHEKVWAYDYDLDTGEQHNQRVFVDFAPLPGRPDGACVDETGCYWIACVGGFAILRITPAGKVDRTIELPVKRPTMPAFGGPGLGTVFVTSIGEREPGADGPGEHGGIYAFDPGVSGLPEPKFG
ncbi:MAG: SMP-30/gluconolactonase/LRE family protein [Acidimicrobiia bacterium]|nr:SMP-30/gluconolactonase/LRE family protein [Acidimicrobiia bacterium]MDX2467484.1 SMP-30/gluconolactonase/LRE family protein [Acidimicrobiia bacterium]